MQETPSLEAISRLINSNNYDEARRQLTALLEADPTNAAAWALVAWTAPDSEGCVQALQNVITHGQDTQLTAWAKRGMLHIEHIGTLDETPPPSLIGWRPPPVEPEPARPLFAFGRTLFAREEPGEPGVPKPRGAGYNLSQIGGGIMLGGSAVLMLGMFSRQLSDMGAGLCGMGLLAIGAGVAFAGYQRSRQ